MGKKSFGELQDSCYDKALKDYVTALSLNPNYADVYAQRSELYKHIGEEDKAVADLTELLRCQKTTSQSDASKEPAKDTAYHEQKIAEYAAAIALNPNDAESYNNRGTAYTALGKYDLAEADFNKSLELKSSQTKNGGNDNGNK
jgi:tetratricopeptide (TPR) repeat protein